MNDFSVTRDIEALGLGSLVSAAYSLAQRQGYTMAEEWHLLEVVLQEVEQPGLSAEFGTVVRKNVRPGVSAHLPRDVPPYANLSLVITDCRCDVRITAGNLPASHTLAAGMICRDRGLAASFFASVGRPRLPVVQSIIYSGTLNPLHRVALMEFYEPLCRWVDRWSTNPEFIRIVTQTQNRDSEEKGRGEGRGEGDSH